MGRNKYSAGEIKEIGKLLRLKNAGNRLQQKLIRHDLRVDYEFNISDFNEPGKACPNCRKIVEIDLSYRTPIRRRATYYRASCHTYT